MRLPWEQLAMEVIEVSAPELGDKLYPDLDGDLAEAAAGWGVVHLVKWALARCPDHLPPSASALVPGPTAARQIARAGRWKGDPMVYVRTLASLPNPVLELLPEGIRVKGLDRYDAAWGDRHEKEWGEWKTAHPDLYPAKPPPKSRRKSGGDPSGSRPSDPLPDPDADADGETQNENQIELHLPAQGASVEEVEKYLWGSIEWRRTEKQLAHELRRPRGFPEWVAGALEAGFALTELERAHCAYLLDDDFRVKGWPTAIFITEGVWRVRARIPPPQKRGFS